MSYILKKSELYYKDYSGTAANQDNPLVTDRRDSSKFDKNEWYEVLGVINAVSKDQSFTTMHQCRLIELLIRSQLPTSFSQNRGGAIAWLINNYKSWRLPDSAK